LRNPAPAAPVKGEMTKRDWNLINEALALYEASAGDFDLSERAQAGLEKRIATLREKVWQEIERRR
jgi:hypothetical protein